MKLVPEISFNDVLDVCDGIAYIAIRHRAILKGAFAHYWWDEDAVLHAMKATDLIYLQAVNWDDYIWTIGTES